MKIKNVFINLAFVFTVFLALFGSGLIMKWGIFNSVGGQYGKAYNDQRITRGILLIPDDWYIKDDDSHNKVWLPQQDKEGFRKRKIVVIEKDSIDSEVDYISKDGNTIEIIYSYRNQQLNINPWEINFQSGDTIKSLTKQELDSILLNWKIKSSG